MPKNLNKVHFNDRIGLAISHHRRRVGISVKSLADCLGVSRQTVHAWERGEHAPETHRLPDIAKALKMSFAELVRGFDH